MGRKFGGLLCPFLGGAGSKCNTMWPGPRPTPVPNGILIHAAVWPQYMGQNWGCPAPFLEGVGSPSNTMSPGPRSTSVPSGILIHPAVWPQQTWGENWGLCPSWGGEVGPHLTQCGLPPCQVSPGWIHQTVWPQCTNVTDRQNRQDRQRCDFTVLMSFLSSNQ